MPQLHALHFGDKVSYSTHVDMQVEFGDRVADSIESGEISEQDCEDFFTNPAQPLERETIDGVLHFKLVR